MNSPFIPVKKAEIAIVSQDAPQEIFKSLKDLNIKTVPAIKDIKIQTAVASHPDMVITPLHNNTVVTAPSVWDYYNRELGKWGIKVLKGKNKLDSVYPQDVPYNVAILKKILIHKLDMTDDKVLEFAKKNNIDLLNTMQGYSKCSLAIVDNISGITSDRGMAKLLQSKGYDILLIRHGYIELPGMNYGFIGGATGNISPKTMVITGRLETHPDKKRIEKFIKDKGVELIYLSDKQVIDIGTIIGLNSSKIDI